MMICISPPPSVKNPFSFDVRDYGVIGNGNPDIQTAPFGTDNTTALQAALDAVNAAGGGTLEVPTSKTYEHSGMLTIYSNTRLLGNGYNSTKLRFTGNGGIGLTTSVAENFIILEDIAIITSDKDNGDSKQGDSGFRIQGTSSEIKAIKTRFEGYSLSGIIFAGSINNVVVAHCYITNCGDNDGAGILSPLNTTSVNAVRLIGNTIACNNGWGIEHKDAEGKGWCLVGNLIEGNTAGGFCIDTGARLNGCLIHGNYFENTASVSSYQLRILGATGAHNTGIDIRGNFFTGHADAHKIMLDYVDAIVVQGNHFAATTGRQISGVAPARVTNKLFNHNFDAGSADFYHDGTAGFSQPVESD